MSYFVVNGSTLKCSMACSLPPGAPVPRAPSYPPGTPGGVIVLPSNKVMSGNQPVATINVEDTQVLPFVMSCMSQSNPTVVSASAAATSAAMGTPMFVPAPCTPSFAPGSKWISGCPKCRISGKLVLNNTSKLNCMLGGTIEVIQTPSMKVKIP